MRTFIIFLLLLLSLNIFAQNATEQLWQQTSEIYGTDDILVNGTTYRPLHPIASGDPFFINGIFVHGQLNLKGRSFQNVLLKFDIEQQKLILKHFVDGAKFELIAFNNNYIKSFSLHGRFFVNIDDLIKNDKAKGFYELIYQGDFLFVREYKKVFVSTFSDKYPYGKYSDTKTTNFLFLEGEKFKISKRKDLYNLFPQHKVLIKKFMKEHKIKLRKSNNNKLNILMQYCDEISTK
jgi:hypothetical protein